MHVTIEQTKEITLNQDVINLEDIVIDGKEWTVRIENWFDALNINFVDPSGITQFDIQVLNGKVRMWRHVSRPNHDHADTHYLLENGKGQMVWGQRSFYPNDNAANIEFGGIEVDY